MLSSNTLSKSPCGIGLDALFLSLRNDKMFTGLFDKGGLSQEDTPGLDMRVEGLDQSGCMKLSDLDVSSLAYSWSEQVEENIS